MVTDKLKMTLSKEATWMAAEAIKQGCVLVEKTEKELQKQRDQLDKGRASDYSVMEAYRKGFHATAAILGRFFGGSTAVIIDTLVETAKSTNKTPNREYYLDEFVEIFKREGTNQCS